MSRYLTRDELAELVGCKPSSLACMRRWLDRNQWPHAVNIAGVPLVAREYYEAKMFGTAARAADSPLAQEPDFSSLER